MNPSVCVRGLITVANEPLYNKAKIPFPPPPDFQRPKENAAIHVLENVLNKVVFKDFDIINLNLINESLCNTSLLAVADKEIFFQFSVRDPRNNSKMTVLHLQTIIYLYWDVLSMGFFCNLCLVWNVDARNGVQINKWKN